MYRQGRSHGNRALVLYAFPRGDEEPVRCGLSVSRKVGGAVERNRVKRLLREALRREEATLPAGLDVVVLARPDARELVERAGLDGVHQSLRELLERAGVGGPSGEGEAAGGPEDGEAAGGPDDGGAAGAAGAPEAAGAAGTPGAAGAPEGLP